MKLSCYFQVQPAHSLHLGSCLCIFKQYLKKTFMFSHLRVYSNIQLCCRIIIFNHLYTKSLFYKKLTFVNHHNMCKTRENGTTFPLLPNHTAHQIVFLLPTSLARGRISFLNYAIKDFGFYDILYVSGLYYEICIYVHFCPLDRILIAKFKEG